MNDTPLPRSCDVLVVGAGPAGSACAQLLARAGLDVLLVDQHAFPRDKICGDGLIPDAHAALRRLGVHDEVASRWQPAGRLGCIGSLGGRVDVPGALAVLPRRELDDILVRAAVRAGARLLAPARFEALVRDVREAAADARAVGARLKIDDASHEVRAGWVVLATGAAPAALIAAGLCERHTPSAIALRGYVRNPAMVDRISTLDVVWHRKLRGGYGWIFPGPGGVFNIGAGLAYDHEQRRAARSGRRFNLRDVLDAFVQCHAPARELMRSGELLGEPKGAPLRCSLAGARWSAPGVLVTGEAAGSTYAFTYEGIGKAMETGMLAAEALLAQGLAVAADIAVRAQYAAALQALRPRFALYERANRVNDFPWLTDLVIWRANRSSRILRRMSSVLDETGNPGNLISVRGITRLLLPSS